MAESPPETGAMIAPLVAAGGGAVSAVLLFGSRLVQAAPDRHSAWDLVVIVDDYGAFHRALVSAGHHRRPAWLLSALAKVLAPNITAFDPGGGLPLAKCAIVSGAHFERALGPRAPDHFLKGRMVQKVALAWRRDAAAEERVLAALETARRDVLRWAGPYLDAGPISAAELARRMLEVSYGGEVRPESSDRVRQVFEAQRDFLDACYDDVLGWASGEGIARRLGGGRFQLADPPNAAARRAMERYFLRSKARATLRWLKHVLTFNDWLTYIQRKVERRTGMQIEIGPWERRLPFLLLWPKVVRVLRHRDGARGAAPDLSASDPSAEIER